LSARSERGPYVREVREGVLKSAEDLRAENDRLRALLAAIHRRERERLGRQPAESAGPRARGPANP
jgi:hypothetical protein